MRELINALEYAVVTCEGKTIGMRDLPHGVQKALRSGNVRGQSYTARTERDPQRLEQFRGNKTKAAEYLGINRKTLREKMQKYGLEKK